MSVTRVEVGEMRETGECNQDGGGRDGGEQ